MSNLVSASILAMPTPNFCKNGRKPAVQAIRPYHVVHLRLLNVASGKVSPLGGFTLAYRASETMNGHITLQYAYTECSLDDNYCRRTGRNIAAARLNGSSVEYSYSLRVSQLSDSDLRNSFFRLDDQGTVDIRDSVFDLRLAVVQAFVSTNLASLYPDDYDLNGVLKWQGRRAFLDLEVISPCPVPKVLYLELALSSIHGLAQSLLASSSSSPSMSLSIPDRNALNKIIELASIVVDDVPLSGA